MRIHSLSFLALALSACTTPASDPGSTQQQLNQKEAECSQHMDAKSCTDDGCDWFALGIPCQQGQPCKSGVCQAPPHVDPCAKFVDQTSCAADAKDQCAWIDFGRPCQQGQPCQSGVCEGPVNGGGGIGGGTGCACPDGKVCVEQLGGPAMQNGVPPQIVCQAVPNGCNAKDVCQCFAANNLDGCHDSADVTGLCLCDNGIR